MKIYYRVSPFLSSNPNPLGSDKFNIVTESLTSFLKTNPGTDITFICDSIPEDWMDIFNGSRIIDASGLGNVGTFYKQLDLIAKEVQDNEHVFLIEDDYWWKEDCLPIIDQALYDLVLISPYDHPVHYTDPRFIEQPKRMKYLHNTVWREAPSNTLTFACQAWVIKQNIDLIKRFGIRDHEMFTELGIDLWVPVPGMACHQVTGLESPYW